MDIKVINIGNVVYIGKDIEAIITDILLSQTGIQYKCSWWDGRIRKHEWLEEFEVTQMKENKTIKIGFK